MVKVLPPGRVWNPLRGFPANCPCTCGSKIKFKKCCKEILAETVSKGTAEFVKSNWEKLTQGLLVLPKPEVKT
jgi:hypothetical protein